MSDRPPTGDRAVSVDVSRSFAPCGWCGLLSETGPVCSICGSPVIDITGWTTVLDVTWPIEPGVQTTPTALWSPRHLARSSLPPFPPPPMPDPPALVDATVGPETESWVVPSLWVPPVQAPQSLRLGAAWSFQPTEGERRLVRMETLRARAAKTLAIGLGATGAIYLIDHALR